MTVLFEGNVQGVGFRYTAYKLARNYQVRGTVENLNDGRVRLKVLGKKSEVQKFLAAIKRKMRMLIHDTTIHEEDAQENFDDFRIV